MMDSTRVVAWTKYIQGPAIWCSPVHPGGINSRLDRNRMGKPIFTVIPPSPQQTAQYLFPSTQCRAMHCIYIYIYSAQIYSNLLSFSSFKFKFHFLSLPVSDEFLYRHRPWWPCHSGTLRAPLLFFFLNFFYPLPVASLICTQSRAFYFIILFRLFHCRPAPSCCSNCFGADLKTRALPGTDNSFLIIFPCCSNVRCCCRQCVQGDPCSVSVKTDQSAGREIRVQNGSFFPPTCWPRLIPRGTYPSVVRADAALLLYSQIRASFAPFISAARETDAASAASAPPYTIIIETPVARQHQHGTQCHKRYRSSCVARAYWRE